jgi:UDP-N-acetyl-D-galactosamine dehydrogenase
MSSDPTIVVVGLGYVGLPLAVALSAHFPTIGYDIDEGRLAELARGYDRTDEISEERLRASSLTTTADPEGARGADVYIVTAPTPVDASNRPDLTPLLRATESVARLLERDRKPVVVFESTVYPGVTEDVCGPLIERISGLTRGEDFFLAYSPERINPGDREHTVDKIIKVVAGESPEVTDRIAAIYGRVTTGGTYRAKSIMTAEAAKVIENAQRDINIAFMNEVAQIFAKLDLSIWDVLDAAGTKWNFLPFQPGLVGGHCIGVDPYYLSHLAQELNHEPRVILAGRDTNDGMGDWIAGQIDGETGGKAGSALVLGVTFKENVPDLRNSKVVDVVNGLTARGHKVTVHDPVADPAHARREYGFELDADALGRSYDLVVCAVTHDAYRAMDAGAIEALVAPGGLVADLKGIWRDTPLDRGIGRWSL